MTALRVWPENPNAAVAAIGVSVVGCTLGIMVVDALFRSRLTAEAASFSGAHEWATTLLMISKATKDELLGRLVIVGGMVAFMGVAFQKKELNIPELTIIFVTAQVIILLPQLSTPTDFTEFLYDALRYVSPGILWGWLYWRYGLVTALLGHAATHVVLDPALHAFFGATRQ